MGVKVRAGWGVRGSMVWVRVYSYPKRKLEMLTELLEALAPCALLSVAAALVRPQARQIQPPHRLLLSTRGGAEPMARAVNRCSGCTPR